MKTTVNSIEKAARVDCSGGSLSEEELALINGYTRREMKEDEVYVFSVVLCDNEVDRDGERFTVESLRALEKLFVGKTGIFDHNPSARNQAARIISCRVETDEGRKTALGDSYSRLVARAYMPKTATTAPLVEAIESGMLKEVSVGCAIGSTRCSVCGEPLGYCSHVKGEVYGGRLCCGELCDPEDAYEFSFVAVPAQREAGVIKSVYGKDEGMEGIIKQLEGGSAVLGSAQCEKLLGYISGLKKSAADGEHYRQSLTSEVLRLSTAVQPDISRETMESVTKGLSIAQLKEFKAAFERKFNAELAPLPQLAPKFSEKNTASNGQFTI